MGVDGNRVRRHPPVLGRGGLHEVGGQRDRLGLGRRRRPGQAAELRRHGRAEEGGIGQAPTELLGHDGDLDRRGPRGPVVRRRAQLAPAGRADRRVELGGPLAVVELADPVDAQAVDDLRGGVAQRDLLGGEADVHSAVLGRRGQRGAHSSRSVRRSTLPEGVRGMLSTMTTWWRRL